MYSATLVVFTFAQFSFSFFIPLRYVKVPAVPVIHTVSGICICRSRIVLEIKEQIQIRFLFDIDVLSGFHFYFRLLWYMGTTCYQNIFIRLRKTGINYKVYRYLTAHGVAISGICLVNAYKIFTGDFRQKKQQLVRLLIFAYKFSYNPGCWIYYLTKSRNETCVAGKILFHNSEFPIYNHQLQSSFFSPEKTDQLLIKYENRIAAFSMINCYGSTGYCSVFLSE